MPRFVVLYHEMPSDHERDSHWDFMLEDGDCLLTWALRESPIDVHMSTGLELPRHRLNYLTKVGPVSNDRGTVNRVDAGVFEWRTRNADAITVALQGEVLKGVMRIRRRVQQHWLWTIERNENASQLPFIE